MRKYLPSRQFIIRLVSMLVLAGIIFGVYKLVIYLKNRSTSKTPTKLLVESLVQKDSNENGIADWEESLWGLDPKKNGQENKDFILAKRKALAESQGVSPESMNQPLSENETLAREFFAAVMTLEQAGNLNEDSLEAVSDAIGKNIEAAPIADIYSASMLSLKPTSDSNTDGYYLEINSLLTKYKDKSIGSELTFISQGLQNNDETALSVAKGVGQAYRSFGADLMKIKVPEDFVGRHTALANNYEKTGRSIEDLSQISTDPIKAMKGLINYKTYSDALVVSFEDLSDF